MKTYAVYLKPKGSVSSLIHSDTLFGAICWAMRDLGFEDLDPMLSDFNDHPRFILSSMSPVLYHDNVSIRFYPRPLLQELTSSQVEQLTEAEMGTSRKLSRIAAKMRALERSKILRKTAYVSEEIFKDIVLGKLDSLEICKRMVKTTGIAPNSIEIIGNLLITKAEREKIEPDRRLQPFFGSSDVQRNQIDRMSGTTVEGLLFFEQQLCFQKDRAGLWFLVRTDDIDLIKPVFRYLNDTGIGGNRTVGKGQFIFELDDQSPFSLADAGSEANCFVALSRYLPCQDEWGDDKTCLSYSIHNIRPKYESRFPVEGTNPIYKKLIRPLGEGSVFPLPDQRKEWFGRIVPRGELDNRIAWQNGMAIPVFARIGGAL